VAMQTDITSYLDFVLTLFFAFGVAFEVPIATIVLVVMGVTTTASLRTKRPYIIVAAFVVGMFLTPPDVISQTLLALPMWILFEFGVFFSGMFVKKQDEDNDDDENSSDESDQPVPAKTASETSSVATAGSEAVKPEKDLSDLYDGKPLRYPEDFVPMSDDEMEAELDRMDEEDDQEDDDEDDPYNDYDDHSGDGGSESSGQNTVDVKLAQVMEYREEENLTAARALLYEVLEEGDESQIRVARNILNELDSD